MGKRIIYCINEKIIINILLFIIIDHILIGIIEQKYYLQFLCCFDKLKCHIFEDFFIIIDYIAAI